MTKPETVEFAFSGTVQGVEISPAHVPFGLMRKFHEDVERLVLGSNQGSLSDTVVQIRQGSYALVVPLPETVRESFELDMSIVASPDSSAYPDPARLAILQGWQKRAALEDGRRQLRSHTSAFRMASVDRTRPIRGKTSFTVNAWPSALTLLIASSAKICP